MTAFRVLLADDDGLSRDFLREALEAAGCQVTAVDDGHAAIRKLANGGEFDVVVSDLRMPRKSGFDVLEVASSHDLAFVLITAYGSADVAVDALRKGADDVLFKPVDLEQLETALARLEKRGRLVAENAYHRESALASNALVHSPALLDVFRVVDRVAASPTTVLVTGESGTGKEVVATELHRRSPRSSGPFIRVNCAALPESLIESELFGHEVGAFTGAASRKLGRFELAHGGTLLLDEIGELPAGLQAKLLRILETSTFSRVGGVESIEVDVRVIASTNADLEAMVAAGTFRADLYYRLHIVPIEVPPLRERREDILPLAELFLAEESRRHGVPHPELEPEARSLLYHYAWPGNVRELRNLMQRAFLLCEGGRITHQRLATWLDDGPRTTSTNNVDEARATGAFPESWVGTSLREVEDAFILATLESVDGKRSEAARLLGVAPRTLYNRLRSIDVES
ncbi:MAG: sigma-54-dependent Fis family transcriptional regulator [Planctomycetes bacterium]|nr:sigma-54-dependent Fis family transcriptional regulator [Planctomycetota bacterium]